MKRPPSPRRLDQPRTASQDLTVPRHSRRTARPLAFIVRGGRSERRTRGRSEHRRRGRAILSQRPDCRAHLRVAWVVLGVAPWVGSSNLWQFAWSGQSP